MEWLKNGCSYKPEQLKRPKLLDIDGEEGDDPWDFKIPVLNRDKMKQEIQQHKEEKMRNPTMWMYDIGRYSRIRPAYYPKEEIQESDEEIAKVALADFDARHGTAHRLVCVEKVVFSVAGGFMYYITFTAIDLAGLDEKITFQGQVWCAPGKPDEVEYCDFKKQY